MGGGGRGGGRRSLRRQGGEEGGGREIGSGEEEVKRTAPGRGPEASPYKIYTFPPPPSGFRGNILLLYHLLNRATPHHPLSPLPLPHSPLPIELKKIYMWTIK